METWTPEKISKISNTLVGLQAELERQYKGESSPFYQQYLGLRNMVTSWFGQSSYTPKEIMTLQIAGAKDLSEAAAFKKVNAEQEIESIKNYRNNLLMNHKTDLKGMKEAFTKYGTLLKDHEEAQTELDKLMAMSKDYVPLVQKRRQIESEIRDNKQSYRVNQRSADHYLRSEELIDKGA